MTPSDSRRRPGYALLVVMGFLLVLLAVWGVAYRSVGSAYRVETARATRRDRDDGVMTALGRGVGLLRTGTPKNPDGSDLAASETYLCYVELETRAGPRWFAVAFEAGPGAGEWSVHATGVDRGGSPTMPETFATPPASP